MNLIYNSYKFHELHNYIESTFIVLVTVIHTNKRQNISIINKLRRKKINKVCAYLLLDKKKSIVK